MLATQAQWARRLTKASGEPWWGQSAPRAHGAPGKSEQTSLCVSCTPHRLPNGNAHGCCEQTARQLQWTRGQAARGEGRARRAVPRPAGQGAVSLLAHGLQEAFPGTSRRKTTEPPPLQECVCFPRNYHAPRPATRPATSARSQLPASPEMVMSQAEGGAILNNNTEMPR